MRIGLVRARHSYFGGAESFLTRFMGGLIESGHEIDLFSSGWEKMDGVTLHKVSAGGPRFLRPLFFAINAERAIKRARPDIVISLERAWSQDIYRAGDGCHREWLIQKARFSPWWKRLSTRLNPLHIVLFYLERRLFESKMLKKVVANSEMVKADILRHYQIPPEKITIIRNGIDAAAFIGAGPDGRLRAELGIDEEAVMLLFVGSGFERKGLMHAIRALPHLKGKGDIRLVAVGKGRAGRYEKEAERLGVRKNVVFTGPRKDVARFYQAADIFILPSIYEPFSNACLEAMAAGLPVITTKANGFSEIIKEGLTGAVVDDPANSREVAAAVEKFLDEKTRAQDREAAKKEAGQYTIDNTVNAFMKLVEELLPDHGKGRA